MTYEQFNDICLCIAHIFLNILFVYGLYHFLGIWGCILGILVLVAFWGYFIFLAVALTYGFQNKYRNIDGAFQKKKPKLLPTNKGLLPRK